MRYLATFILLILILSSCTSSGIELDTHHEPALRRAPDLVRWSVVRQIKRHQRLKPRVGRQRGENAIAIRRGLFGGDHRRPQIGHDHGAGEDSGRVGQHRMQVRPVTQVKVPVVGPSDGEETIADHVQRIIAHSVLDLVNGLS